MIKAVIFDMDGVIIDSEPLWWHSVDIQMTKHGIDIKQDKSYNEFINKYIRGRGQRQAINAYKKRYGLKGNYQTLLKERINILLKVFDQQLKPVKGTIPYIKMLHKNKIPLAVASSSPPRVINYTLNRYKLKKYFKIQVSGENLKHGKPHPNIFLATAKKLKINPKNILVIEDSRSGVIAAKRAGMKCVGLKQPYMPYQYLKSADLIVKNLQKINLTKLINI